MDAALDTTLDLCARLLGGAVLLQSAEMLALQRSYAASGIFAWDTLRAEHDHSRLLSWFYAAVFGARGFTTLTFLRLLSGVVLVLDGEGPTVLFVGLSSWLTNVRWRGQFNGGSDTLTSIVTLGLCVAQVAGGTHLVRASAVYYIAVQTLLSYFVAGVTKLKEPAWRDGRALTQFLKLRRYSVPVLWQHALTPPSRARAASYALISFECAFPLALLHPTVCHAWLTAGCVFHLLNAWVLGLNRFWPIWFAAYPTLAYVSHMWSARFG
jgi:hypothetical protein